MMSLILQDYLCLTWASQLGDGGSYRSGKTFENSTAGKRKNAPHKSFKRIRTQKKAKHPRNQPKGGFQREEFGYMVLLEIWKGAAGKGNTEVKYQLTSVQKFQTDGVLAL